MTETQMGMMELFEWVMKRSIPDMDLSLEDGQYKEKLTVMFYDCFVKGFELNGKITSIGTSV